MFPFSKIFKNTSFPTSPERKLYLLKRIARTEKIMVRYQQNVRFSFIKNVERSPAVRMEEALLNAKNTTAGALGTT